MTLRDLRELRCEKSIAEHFLVLVTNYLDNSRSRKNQRHNVMLLLIELCNHHRHTLWKLYRDKNAANQHHLKTWLSEIASPPSGEWAELRHSLTPLIRTFGQLPRPRGSQLFSPLDEALGGTGLEIRESGVIGEHEVTTLPDDSPGDVLSVTDNHILTDSSMTSYSMTSYSMTSYSMTSYSMTSYSISQGGMSWNPIYSMTSGSGPEPGLRWQFTRNLTRTLTSPGRAIVPVGTANGKTTEEP